MIWSRFFILNCCAYHLLTDLDPCINVSCKYFAVCKAFGPRDARCICVDNCPSFEEPVCSSNGTTYDNVCVFQREMCHLRANFTIIQEIVQVILLVSHYILLHFLDKEVLQCLLAPCGVNNLIVE